MASIRKRETAKGVSYLARVRLKGHPPQTASFSRLTDARKWVQDTESAIRDGRHFKTAEAKRHTFADAIERYNKSVLPKYTAKEQANRRPILAWWNDAIGAHLLADLNSGTFAECRDKLLATPSQKGGTLHSDTIRKYFNVARCILKVCVNEWRWLERSPLKDGRVEMPALPRGRVRFLDDAERERLLRACRGSDNGMLNPIVVMALSTGMRQGEILNLKWPDVDLKKGVAILQETKNGERRRVPITGYALEVMREYAKVRRLDSEFVFPGRTGKPVEFRKHWLKALSDAGIADFRFHDLRHCTASYLAMNGASLAEIAEILGHKTLQMVKRYSHLSDSHVSGVLERMNARVFEVSLGALATNEGSE
jgi:integrase